MHIKYSLSYSIYSVADFVCIRHLQYKNVFFRILEADFEELTVTHPSVVLLYTTINGFLEKEGIPLLHDISVLSILAFSTRKEYR